MSKKYNDKYYARYGDPRTAQWLLMDNQIYVFVLGAAYLLVTQFILPRVMRNRNPFKLHKLTVGYNIGMMFLNAWLLCELSSNTWLNPDFNWFCQSVDWSNTEEAIRVPEIGWIFLITTLLEKITTILIILRKKDSKLSIIHPFIRVQAPIVAWYGLKFAPGGYNSLYILLTTFVNMVVHFHHAVVMVFPSLWNRCWKKLTLPALYVMQFTIILNYYSQLYFFPPKDCKLSFFILRLNMGVAILFFIFAKDFCVSKSKNKDDKMASPKPSEKLQKIN